MSKLIAAVMRSDLEAMQEAISSGEDVNQLDVDMTPLLWAIFCGHFDAARLLLDKGADPNLHLGLSGSPLWHAGDDFGLMQISGLLRSYGAIK
jgi:ankyrin repeat protein